MQSIQPLVDNFLNIPPSLRALRQWVCWKLKMVDNRITKVPYSVTGAKAATNDASTWSTFDECLNASHDGARFSGIGFVFTADNVLTGIDLDHHRNAATGELDDFAKDIGARMDSYTEASQSGTGVHIIVEGELPSGKGRRDSAKGIELY